MNYKQRNIVLLLVLLQLFQHAGYAQTGSHGIKVSDDIKLIQLSPKVYVHISISEMQAFGKVSSNGLILLDSGRAFLFDTPVTDEQTKTLLDFIADSLHAGVIGFVPNHWHEDCMGGLAYLNKRGIKSYASQKTIDIAKEKGLPVPEVAFKDSLLLKLNDLEIGCYYFGGAHTPDNIVVWLPSENILFAGCMVKGMSSETLGNLSDADLNAWPSTIEKVIAKFPLAEIVVPGHGRFGGKELLTHTQELLKNK